MLGVHGREEKENKLGLSCHSLQWFHSVKSRVAVFQSKRKDSERTTKLSIVYLIHTHNKLWHFQLLPAITQEPYSNGLPKDPLRSRKQILQTPFEQLIDFHTAAKFLIYISNSLWLKNPTKQKQNKNNNPEDKGKDVV